MSSPGRNQSLNFRVLRKPNSPDFDSELESAPKSLELSDCSHFFKILLSHFRSGVSTEQGSKILLCIERLLRTEKFTESFLDGEFQLVLPFDNRKFSSHVFEILRLLLNQATDFFDGDLIKQFEKIIPLDPMKALTIIALYAKDFSEIDNPWPMLDLLFQHPQDFQTPELASKYAALLAYLYKTYSDFRQGRGKNAWNALCQMLRFEDVPALQAVYCGLCELADGRVKVKLPLDDIVEHLRYDDLQDNVLNLLLLMTPPANEKFCGLLKKIARKNVRATLVLLTIADSPKSANIILSDYKWLNYELPTAIDTLRLFLALFKHKELRPIISELPNLFSFLTHVIQDRQPPTLAIVSTIVRKLNLSREIINQMSDSGFLQDFITITNSCNDDIADQSLFALFGTIMTYDYVPEYLKVCDIISDTIMTHSKLKAIATQIAIGFCQYPKCIKRMKEKRLDAYYKKHLSDPELYKDAETFLSLIGWNANQNDRHD